MVADKERFYFALEYRENSNDMLFQKREFFISLEARNKRFIYLSSRPDKYCEFIKSKFIVSEVINE